MKRIRIAVSSVTYAEKGRLLLRACGTEARIVRLHPSETKNGCAFALELQNPSVSEKALCSMLADGHIRYSEILTDEGEGDGGNDLS